MPNVLIFCNRYSLDSQDFYLTNELVCQFAANQYEVTVLAFGDVYGDKPSSSNSNPLIQEIILKSKNNVKYIKYISLWFEMTKAMIKLLKSKKEFDLSIGFLPFSICIPIVLLQNFLKIKKKICIVFDFFPNHHVETESIPSFFNRPLYYLERQLLSYLDILTGMTPANVNFIKKYYNLNKRVELLPLWGYRGVTFDKFKMGNGVNMVFGGQIVKGRSIEFLINFIVSLRNFDFPITLSIFSEGEGFEQLSSKYCLYRDFIFFNKRIKREDYLNQLSKFDIGAIVTDPRVSSPTFPSKLIDYMNAGIPAFCIVEKQSDIESFINDKRFIFVNYFESDNESIIQAKNFLNSITADDSNFDLTFTKRFKVDYVVDQLISY